MSTTEYYQNLETILLDNLELTRYVTERIAEKMGLSLLEVERAIYQACISTDTKPGAAIVLLHEFLVALKDKTASSLQLHATK